MTTYAVKISSDIIKLVKEYCENKGIKQGYFVEKALQEKIEREEDIEDAYEFTELKIQENNALSFEDYLKKRKKN